MSGMLFWPVKKNLIMMKFTKASFSSSVKRSFSCSVISFLCVVDLFLISVVSRFFACSLMSSSKCSDGSVVGFF